MTRFLSRMKNAEYWISHLNLQPHPEGGFYKETYRAHEMMEHNALPKRFGGARNFSTSIYFLLREGDRSLFHRIKSDELWHFHAGGSLTLFLLSESGLQKIVLGSSVHKGETLQVVVPAGTWFGATVNDGSEYVLSGCTVSPGFDFHDFEIARRNELLEKFPEQGDLIKLLTK